MSYREEGGQVVLTMNWQDYERLLAYLGMVTAVLAGQKGEDCAECRLHLQAALGLVNRLNEGNPNYTPYVVEEKKS